MAIALVIFALTYILIAARRFALLPVGRPAGALLGAAAMVVFGVLTPVEAYGSIDLRTISLLFGMMVITGYLQAARFFPALSRWVLRRASSPRALLGAVVWISGGASAFLVNDTVCLMFTPVVLALALELEVDALPLLMALATSSNIGSVATLTGNPQNMLIGTASHIPYRQYLLIMAPLTVCLLAVNHFLLLKFYSRELQKGPKARKGVGKSLIHRPLIVKSLVVLACVVAAWLLGADLSFTAVAGAAILIAWGRREPRRTFERLDWTLLLFFAGLFVVIAGVEKSGAVTWLTGLFPTGGGIWGAVNFSIFSVLCSNLFSNVPFVLVAAKWVGSLPSPELHWYLLALTSTLAGNLTLVGSMANLIVAALSRGVRPVGFREYLRYGVPITILTTAIGVAYLLLVAA